MINFFLGGMFAGTMTDHGLGYAMDLFFWPAWFIYFIVSFIGLVCLVLVGIDFREDFLGTNPSYYFSKRRNRRLYFFAAYVFPWVIGSFLLFMIKFPDKEPQHIEIEFHDLLLSLSLICIIIPMFFQKKKSRRSQNYEVSDRQKGILWPMVGSAMLLMIVFRFFLSSSFYSLF